MIDGYAIEALSVSKQFGTRVALSDVDLLVEHGAIHALLGPNGAGKTTMLRILLGLVRCDAGTIALLGSCQSHDRRIPDHVAGFVETPAFYPHLTGLQNLTLLARLDGRAEPQSAIDAALDVVGLGSRAGDAVRGYSAGMRQRLGLAAACLRAPKLLVLDEPTSSLDPATAQDVRALVQRLASEGTAVLWSSHDLDEIEDLCAPLTVLDRGRVILSGSVDDLRALTAAATHTLRTSDDMTAIVVAARHPEIAVARGTSGELNMWADPAGLDAYIIALGCAGVAVRELARRSRTLETAFLDLTRQSPTAMS